MMHILLKINKPLLMTGESGVGKTSLIVPYLFSLK
jgi:putative ribosome biogenesis GTPase RsgA